MIYLDTNVFIDFVEGKPELAEPLKLFFDALSMRPGAAFTSELTLAEVLAPSKSRGPRPAHLKRQYLDMIVWNPAITLMPVSRSILYETADLRKFTGHKLPDAIHVVTAINSGCRYFASRDADARKLPKGLERVVSDADGAHQLIEALHG